jgi:hypothetical protein
VPCLESKSGHLDCRIPPKNTITTIGYSFANGRGAIPFTAPSGTDITVHTLEGDVAPTLVGQIPEIGFAFYVHIGANLTGFGIEAASPLVVPFLPGASAEKLASSAQSTIASGTDEGIPWSLVEVGDDPTKLLCIDTGEENSYESCGPGPRPGDRRFSILGFRKSRNTKALGFAFVCAGAVKGLRWVGVDGATETPTAIASASSRHSIFRVPGQNGVLTFDLAGGRSVRFPIGSTRTKTFNSLLASVELAEALPACS